MVILSFFYPSIQFELSVLLIFATLFPQNHHMKRANSVDDGFMAKLSFSIQLNQLVFVQLCAQNTHTHTTIVAKRNGFFVCSWGDFKSRMYM